MSDSSRSPWHDGERALHARVSVMEKMEAIGRRVIRDYMPEQHRTFFAQLPFVLLGAVDARGDVWATLAEGTPGFVSTPDPRLLRVATTLDKDDPAAVGVHAGAAIGLLGIELHTRRRNRMNGRIVRIDDTSFDVSVEQSFGNCPQYIQLRDTWFVRPPGARHESPTDHGTELDEEARSTIAASDTFFVSSYVDVDGDQGRRGVDVSHRGGKPGFVRVDGNVLTIPDFAGNLHFNTLGNFLVNPRAGLVFIDFDRGDVLQLTGRAEVLLDSAEIAAFQGAERMWRFTVERVVRRRRALALRWRKGAPSPNSLMTGSWEEAAKRLEAEALRRRWRPFRVSQIVDESRTIRSFVLQPADDAGLPLFEAGQHLPVRLRPVPGAVPIVRTYTLSTAPSDGVFRISVKRQGVASRYLHESVAVGDVVEARSPEGRFTVDARERRPLVLVSGGVGITPMLSMLRHVVYEGLRTRNIRPTWFIHASRSRAERPFDAELAELAAAASGSVTIVNVLSEPEQADLDAGVYRGRIDVALLRRVLPFDDHDFYLCGPAAMTQALYDALRDLRIPDDRIHAEAFGPSTLARRSDPGAPHVSSLPRAATGSVRVVFSRSAKEARWHPGGRSLLEIAEGRGLNPEFSCRGGTCGTCRTRVVEGSVTYASPPAAHHAPDEALICCAVPAEAGEEDARLVLDL